MLLERESMPTGDRVTATAVMRIARELEGALGGPYIQIAEQLQKPDIEQVFAMMEADGTMLPIDRRLLKTEILTGAAALSKQMDLDNLLTALQIVSTYPEGLNRINLDVVLDRVFMGLNVDTAGLMKTAEQLQAELQQRMREQIMPDAAKQAFKSLGDMAVQRAAQP
jgi:predicted ATP-grasp superfamily ATP-dependent carboligase